MTLQELKALLERTGLPLAYRFFRDPPPPPYLCYLSPYSRNFAADGAVYHRADRFQVELYTRKKDPEAESLVESVLGAFYWEKSETYIESEQLYQQVYKIEV